MGTAAEHGGDATETRTEDPISCLGHAFDEELRCTCGVSWFDHQASPRPCRIAAQRCKRHTSTTDPEPV